MTLYRAVLLLLVLLALGCAGSQTPMAFSDGNPEESSGLQPSDYPTQRLLRVRYQGQDGEVGFRTVLRVSDPTHFQMRAVDLIGRPLWGIEYADPEVYFINYREKLDCRTAEPIAIHEMALEFLPVAELPAVLLGRLPRPLFARRPGDEEGLVDDLGRRWSVSRDGPSISGWTMWREGRPLLWFRRVAGGGILSHREGSQFRWRETLVEPLDEAPQPLESPARTRTVTCESLATGT